MINSLLDIDEIAAHLRVSPKTIYRWVGQNLIPFVKLHRHLRFNQGEVDEFFRRKTEEGKPACFQWPALIRNSPSRPKTKKPEDEGSLKSWNGSLAPRTKE